MNKRLLVAGGGIGGMATALARYRAGTDVTLFEGAPAFTEVGAGMSLWPNATRILQSLGVLERVLALGEPVTQFNLQRPNGKMITRLVLSRPPDMQLNTIYASEV